MGRRQGALRPLNFASEALKSSLVFAKVLVVLLLNQFQEVVHDALVKVFTSEMCVACGSTDY